MEKDDSQIYANGSSIAPSEAQTPKDSTRSPGRLHWAQEETTTDTQEPEDDHAAVLKISSQTMPPAARIFYGVYLGSSGMIEAAIAQGAQSTAQVGFSMTSLRPWLLLPPPPPPLLPRVLLFSYSLGRQVPLFMCSFFSCRGHHP